VQVFGRTIRPGDLIHADKHGFMVIAPEEQAALLEAARFMDSNECNTVIPAARESAGRSTEEVLDRIESAIAKFSANVKATFKREGEW
jgi:4-hydroxy-4-methyl-2-oxoglutarate aldolase